MFVEIVRVVPHKDYTVSVHFADGKVTRYDVSDKLDNGVFKALKDKSIFMTRCTILNDTLAWDVSGTQDPYSCIDIDPVTLYNSPEER